MRATPTLGPTTDACKNCCTKHSHDQTPTFIPRLNHLPRPILPLRQQKQQINNNNHKKNKGGALQKLTPPISDYEPCFETHGRYHKKNKHKMGGCSRTPSTAPATEGYLWQAVRGCTRGVSATRVLEPWHISATKSRVCVSIIILSKCGVGIADS